MPSSAPSDGPACSHPRACGSSCATRAATPSIPPEAYPLSPPTLPLQLPGSGSTSTSPILFDASSGGSPNVEYRVLAEPIQVNGSLVGTVIVAVPLDPLHHTLGRLVLIELLVSIGVLGGVGALAWWMVRRNLRPLDEMAATAGAIAGGDLSQRVRRPTNAPRWASSATRSTPC